MNSFREIKDKFSFYYSMTPYELEHAHRFTEYFVKLTDNINSADALMLWGLREREKDFLKLSKQKNKPLYYFEDGFIRSIFTAWANVPDELKSGISFTVDDKSSYFNANVQTNLEQLLNNYDVTDEQIKRARKVINKIIYNKISKYNNQSLKEKIYGNLDKKVLVIDQSYNDASITHGWGSEDILNKMISDAVKYNRDHEILVKVHPDTIAQKKSTNYFTDFKAHKNIIFIYDEINPIVLLKQIDKVYVCTSQLGFEALLCGKDVYTYGMPFYAGWGVTYDSLKCKRRIRKRSIEEIFYITYILYSYYVNPEKKSICEIEEAIEYLIKKRDDYFNQTSNTDI